MRTADFDYSLPPELIAQQPAAQRDQSRLLILHRGSGSIEHKDFRDILEYIRPGDVLVLNNSRVIPARLRGLNEKTGGQFEILLLEENAPNDWWAMLRPGKRARVGTQIRILRSSRRERSLNLPELGRAPRTSNIEHPTSNVEDLQGARFTIPITATVIDTNAEGHRHLQFSGTPDILTNLDELGEIPLPPYIARDHGTSLENDKSRYQTVFANPFGSVAAPTAGLHFTESILKEIRERGAFVQFVTLHVGLGTFAPVKAENLSEHIMHEERFEITRETAQVINAAKSEGRRIIAVGTTSVRTLESVARKHNGKIIEGRGRTNIFIHPPAEFKIVDTLLTNFHLPCSTLLMLVSAFAKPGTTAGREMILVTYAEAIRERYRFFSYGDAMLIL
jgi:S-adenosylmethionine:tRNA ribosyltransferase-isomerase